MRIGENRMVGALSIAIAGLVGGLAMAGFLAIMEGLRLINFSWMTYLGVFVGLAPGNSAWIVGLGVHLIFATALAFAYALAFRYWDRSGISVGFVLAMVHWLVKGILLGAVEPLHPIISNMERTPGYLWTGYTFETFLLMFIAYCIYGITVGGVYHRYAVREELSVQSAVPA